MKVRSLEEARDKKIALSFKEIAELDYFGKNNEAEENQALMLLRKRQGDSDLLQQHADIEGSRKIIPYGWGHNGFVGYTTRGQLKRFAPTGYDLPFGPELKRPDCPRVLGSIGPVREVAGVKNGYGWRVEYLNEVSGKHGTEKELLELKIFLARLGFYVWDKKTENLRALPDGDETPIFVDPDIVARPLDDAERANVAAHAKMDLPTYYWGERQDRRTWKQVQCFPQLNPEHPDYCRLLGFVEGKELQLIINRMGVKHPLAEAIGVEGRYVDMLPHDLQSLLQDFRQDHKAQLDNGYRAKVLNSPQDNSFRTK